MDKENKISNKMKGDLIVIIDVNEFYNKDNWKQYVPLEAFKELTKHVAETHLKDTTVKNLLSITYSVDDYGENPIYIEYLDEKEQKHLVKLKPAIHEELDSVLKQYAKITYVDSEITKAIQTSKDYTDVTKEALTILINGSKEEGIKVSKAYTDVEINKLNTNLKQYIDEHDNSVVNTLTTLIDSSVTNATNVSKEYTDDEINKVKQEISSESESVLQQANDYTDDLRDELTPQIEANKNRLKIKNGTSPETDVEPTGHVTFEVNDGIKAIEVKQNDSDEMPSERVDFSDFALNTDIEPLTSKLSNIWASHKAPFIYWLPNIDVNTMKLENTENDVKVTLNDGDVVYWGKNPTGNSPDIKYNGSEDVTNINFIPGQPDKVVVSTSSGIGMNSNLLTTQQMEDFLNNTSKLSEIPTGGKAAYIYYDPNIDVNTMKLENAENDVKVTINDGDTVYWGKNPTETRENVVTKDYLNTQLENYESKTEASVDHDKLSQVPTGHKQPYISWYPNIDCGYIRLAKDGNETKMHINNMQTGLEEIAYLSSRNPANFVTESSINSLTQAIQEIANKVDNIEIGERTKINFNLYNTELGGTTDPTIIRNESNYIKIDNTYLISVYLTFTVSVTPTSSQKLITCGMTQDIPGGNPFLTLTSVVNGKNSRYTNTIRIPTNQNFLQFYLPAIPATDTYEGMEINIYGSAITKIS